MIFTFTSFFPLNLAPEQTNLILIKQKKKKEKKQLGHVRRLEKSQAILGLLINS